MKAFVSIFVVFFGILPVFGQKLVEKTLVNSQSRVVHIDADKCYAVDLKTAVTDKISVNATLDGEYRKDLVVVIEEEGANVFISADFQPNFIKPNDKLSAHKVLSISLDIVVPEQMRVNVVGTSSNINATGSFRGLQIRLADGACRLSSISESIDVKSQSGPIYLETGSGTILATSNFGAVYKADIPEGDTRYVLHSIEGDVHIMKIE